MTNQQILERAIQKAIDGGWDYTGHCPWLLESEYWNEYPAGWSYYDEFISLRDIIFNHDFAKAVWPGPSKVNTYSFNDETKKTDGMNVPLWQYHLQQMVIADDPIKYLGDNT